MKIEIWSIGKESETFINEGVQFYLKKLKPFCTVNFIRISPPRRSSSMSILQMKKDEEKLILDKIKPEHYLILMDEKGENYTSVQWAKQIDNFQNKNIKTLVFIIGGPWGVNQVIKEQANEIWTLSTLTFPHQLVRLLMAEQLYRSFSILNHSSYHHE